MTSAPDAELTMLDVALGQGEAAQLAAARARIGVDPMQLLDLADEVAFVQSARLLVVQPGPAYGAKLAAVVRRAEQLAPPPPVAGLRSWLCFAAAAAAVFLVLLAWDPLRPHMRQASPSPAGFRLAPSAADQGHDALEVAIDEPASAWDDDIGVIRRRLDLEATPLLRESFDDGLRRGGDGLRAWLEPRNLLMLARFDFELRASAELRRAALAQSGGLPAIDERVQELADEIAALGADVASAAAGQGDASEAASDPVALSFAVRALVAAGAAEPARRSALASLGRGLAAGLSKARGEALAFGLAGLIDAALATGDFAAEIRLHGDRLVADLLAIDAETWSRRLPAWLLSSSPPPVVGEAARVLARLPAFGIEPKRCMMARSLLVGALRDRIARGDDGPAVVAALLYGGGDLLPADERAARERSLRRWKAVRLAPDFVLCHQFAWAFAPGRAGFARHQSELRELAVMPAPAGLRDRSVFCLCLATGYAAPGDLAAAAAGRGGS
jgi:hypothetical protein